jgi:uncharacterized protein YecT (DUF1311 family)
MMLDGKTVASSPMRTQTFGQAGNHQSPIDVPTIGETVSHFWAHHRYEGGFEGVLAAFRVSAKQKDWLLAQGIRSADASDVETNESHPTDAGSRQWLEVKPGQTKGDFTLRPDHRLYYQNAPLQGFVIPGDSEGVWISPASVNGDVLCFSLLGKRAQGILVHLPTLSGGIVLDGSRLEFGLSAVQWTSWSPEGTYWLAAHYYEAHPELFVITARELEARRVTISLDKEHEEQVFELESVKWDSSEQFRMRAKINCNPYTSQDTCSDDERKKTLRVYDLVVNARTLDVSATVQSGPPGSAEVAGDSAVSVTPSFDCSKASTPTEKLICREPELASMEREMVSAYRQVIDQAPRDQKAIVSREHLQWFSQYARTCDAVRSDTERKDCVTKYLRNRTQQLLNSRARQ